MKYFKLIALFLILSCFALTAYAENPNDQLTIEYLELSKTKEMFEATIETYVQQISAQNPSVNQAELRKFFNAYMGWEVLKTPTIQLVSQTFTAKELQDIIAFHKTQSGKSYADKSPQLSAGISKIIATNLQETMSKLQQQ